MAAWSALGEDESVSTVDLRVDYLEPAGWTATCARRRSCVRKGNRVCHVRVAVTQGGGAGGGGRAAVYNIHRRGAGRES